jgi:multidrug efflux pump subunit AcrA (membrane-fusion protein)
MDSLRVLIRRHRIPVAGTAAAIIVIALAAWLRAGNRAAGADGELVTVSQRTFSASVAAVGAVKPQIGAEVRVGSRISGRVQRLRANIGDRVRKGDIIAELETAELDALIAQRRAELELAEARLSAIDSTAPQEIARAEAEVVSYEASAKLAADEWDRHQTLLRNGVATRAEADAARERHLVAQARLEATRRALAVIRTGNTEHRKQAQAEVDRARAALVSAQVDRSFTIIRSPISGIVASVSTQEGETVAAGLSAPTFVTVVDLDRLQVDAYVDEVDIGKIAVGQRVTFSVDAFPARDFEGRVAAIYPSATLQDNVVKYIVAVSITAQDGGQLRPEMTASVRVELEKRTVLAVPTRAIRREEGQSVVFVWQDRRAEPRRVRTGWRDGPWVEIVEGLRDGEQILLDPPAPTPGASP